MISVDQGQLDQYLLQYVWHFWTHVEREGPMKSGCQSVAITFWIMWELMHDLHVYPSVHNIMSKSVHYFSPNLHTKLKGNIE